MRLRKRTFEALPRVLTLRYQRWTYDVWGNARDGWDVNDRFKSGTVDIRCKRSVFNVGSVSAFACFAPSYLQIARTGIGAPDFTGDIGMICGERRGKPIGELNLIGVVCRDGSVWEVSHTDSPQPGIRHLRVKDIDSIRADTVGDWPLWEYV